MPLILEKGKDKKKILTHTHLLVATKLLFVPRQDPPNHDYYLNYINNPKFVYPLTYTKTNGNLNNLTHDLFLSNFK